MKEGTRIEVHFNTKKGPKTVIIGRTTKIQGILFNPSKPPRDSIPKEIVDAQPDLASIEAGDGPGVCYMIDGTLHCW